ncbi:hypothetical protein AVEN_255236-1 [Araneus ventricosus]|uniref:Uncharacterized protein n=1 Tax=Araneus ventricosus TaxID=182803 RepID=A0A4Y2BA58_ARAVE|nr:hypothetical protein AVEN_255236-1 [Araneus ventricosus]
MCKTYEMTGSTENKRGRGKNRKQVKEKTMLVRLAQEKNDVSSREIVEDLKLKVSALTARLRIKHTELIICVSEIVMINGKMTVSICVNILSRNLRKSVTILRVVDGMDGCPNNDPKHMSKIPKDYFSKNKIKILEWPPQSSNLNPI